MTATDELRRMLDERGVKYQLNERTKVFEWRFDGTDGDGSAHATEVDGGINIMACSLTPAQAIAATLGRGTCKLTPDNHYRVDAVETTWGCVCSACGAFHKFNHGEKWAFCPSCGAKVVRE